jgi:hypothetical protein
MKMKFSFIKLNFLMNEYIKIITKLRNFRQKNEIAEIYI